MSTYTVELAIRSDGMKVPVVMAPSGALHDASRWTAFLTESGSSPNTVIQYARRVAAYLTWINQHADWQRATVAHLVMWRNVIAQTPIPAAHGRSKRRKESTVRLWITPVRSFYEWADAMGLIKSDVARQMTTMRYFAPGTSAGGEHGTRRPVLIPALSPKHAQSDGREYQWIESAEARSKLQTLILNPRDRFLIDLLYHTGIRIGEALCLFLGDIHFGGGSPELNCRVPGPHFHVRLNNPVQNRARAKGRARTLFVSDAVVDRYIDYMLQRAKILGVDDQCPHVLVNTDGPRAYRGSAMSYAGARRLLARCSRQIAFPLTGPHTLRHTFATRLVRGIDVDPVPLDVVQDLLGHRSINSTRLYTHNTEETLRGALNLILPRTANLGD